MTLSQILHFIFEEVGPGLDIISPQDKINSEALNSAMRADFVKFNSKHICLEVVR